MTRISKIDPFILFENDPNYLNLGVYLSEEGYKTSIPFDFQSGQIKGKFRDLPHFMIFSKKSPRGKEKLEEILADANEKGFSLQEVRTIIEKEISDVKTYDKHGQKYLEETTDTQDLLKMFTDYQRLGNRENN